MSPLVVISGERSLQQGPCVPHADVLLYRNVSPVRHLNNSLQVSYCQERRVVFIVYFQFSLQTNWHFREKTEHAHILLIHNEI